MQKSDRKNLLSTIIHKAIYKRSFHFLAVSYKHAVPVTARIPNSFSLTKRYAVIGMKCEL